MRAAGRYKFVSYKQLIKLGIDKYTSNLSALVSELSEKSRPLIKKIPHEIGKEVKIYLTRRGRDALIKQCGLAEEDIHFYPGTIESDTQDTKHRTFTINLHIDLDFSCYKNQVELLFCDRYFDFTGSNRVSRNLKSKTAVLYKNSQSLKADIAFKIQTQKQQELYLLEIENGKDTKKAVEKCIRHGQAILKGSANEKYSFDSGYRTLWVFEHESTMKSAMERIMTEVPLLHTMIEYFLFKPLGDIEGKFFEGWLNLAGQERKMYY